MEEPKQIYRSSKKLTDEILAINKLIIEYRADVNSNDERKNKGRFESLASKATIAFFVIIGSIMTALYLLPTDTWGDTNEKVRFVIQLIVVLSYALGGVVLLLYYFSLKELFSDFTGQLFGINAEAAKNEAILFEALDQFSPQTIKHVANRFELMNGQLSYIKSFLIGAIQKVGVIPGLLAAVFAMTKIASSSGFFSWLELLSVALLVIYISMFPLTGAAISLKRMSAILNAYLSLVRPSEEAEK